MNEVLVIEDGRLDKDGKIINNNFDMDDITSKIYEIRGVYIMLDSDLAIFYQCKNGTKSINLAVKRNIDRFPNDFYFQLTERSF